MAGAADEFCDAIAGAGDITGAGDIAIVEEGRRTVKMGTGEKRMLPWVQSASFTRVSRPLRHMWSERDSDLRLFHFRWCGESHKPSFASRATGASQLNALEQM